MINTYLKDIPKYVQARARLKQYSNYYAYNTEKAADIDTMGISFDTPETLTYDLLQAGQPT